MSNLDEIIKKLENLDIYSNSINLDLESILKDTYYSYPEIEDFEITGSNLKSFCLDENEGDIYFCFYENKEENKVSLRSLKDLELRKIFPDVLQIFKEFQMKKLLMVEAVQCYNRIDEIGIKLNELIEPVITRLLDNSEYDEAKRKLKSFYADAKHYDDVILIEHDTLLARIYRLQM